MKFKIGATALAFCVAAAMAPAHADVIGTADSSSSIPFSTYLGGYYFQQVYNKTNFSSAIDISKLSFYNSLTPGGAPATGNFKVFLTTTTEAIPTFDTNFVVFPVTSTNLFDGTLPALSSGRMDIDLSSAFHYDPAAGNLMVTILNTDLGSGTMLFDADYNDGNTNARFSAYTYDLNQGLVTGFNEASAPVPLPAGLPLLLSGLGALGGMLRRRRAR